MSKRSTAAESNPSTSSAFDDVHDFQLKRRYYLVLGIKGTYPSEQHSIRETYPELVCRKCGKKALTTTVYESPSSDDDANVFSLPEWKNRFMSPKDPTILNEQCGEIVTFEFGYHKFPCQRALIDEKCPNSKLAKEIAKQWDSNAYCDIQLDHGHKDYFPFVLDFLREDKVLLPIHLIKEKFLEDLQAYGIGFDCKSIHTEIDDPETIMPRAVIAARAQLDAYDERFIHGDLKKDLEEAQMRLAAQ